MWLTEAVLLILPASVIAVAINAPSRCPPLFFLVDPLLIFRVLSCKTLKIVQNLGGEVLLLFCWRTPQKVDTRSPNLILSLFFISWVSTSILSSLRLFICDNICFLEYGLQVWTIGPNGCTRWREWNRNTWFMWGSLLRLQKLTVRVWIGRQPYVRVLTIWTWEPT